MNKNHYRFIGKVLAIIGMIILFLFPIVILMNWTYPGGSIVPQPSDILILAGFMLFGFILTSSGMIIHRRFKGMQPFLAKGGEPIHSVTVWKKGSESGLFLTSCERVVSINQDSRATAHVGYRLVPAKRATCSECTLREGKAALDSFAHGRIY